MAGLSAKVRAVASPNNKVRVYWGWGPNGTRHRDTFYRWDVQDPYREAVRHVFPGALIEDGEQITPTCKEFTVTVEEK